MTTEFDDSACGTLAGFWRHRRAGTPPCQPCRRSHSDQTASAQGKTRRIRRHIIAELERRYPDIYTELRSEALLAELSHATTKETP